MGNLQITPAEYRSMLAMSSSKFLLVEGKDDKGAFRSLLYELCSKANQVTPFESIVISSAEDLKEMDGVGSNCQKVETICMSIQGTPLAERHIGFVDRQFRGFDIFELPKDKINGHNVINGVVWSRGHSIENYCFDFFILHSSLREHSNIDRLDLTLELFRKIFDAVIRAACAFSLAAEESKKLQRVKGRINWQMLEINGSEVKLKVDVLKHELINKPSKGSLTEEEYMLIIEKFYTWYQKIEKVELSCVRWLCHGHIGMNFIWASYQQCVYKIYKSLGFHRPEVEVQKLFDTNENVRFRACVSSWIRSILDNNAEYPREIPKFFDLFVP